MKKALLLITMLLLCAQALALDTETITIEIKVNQPPIVDPDNSYPQDGYVINEGATLQISVVATDANNDMLEYQFLVNDVVERGWGAASVFDYVLDAGDTGLKRIKAGVRDGMVTVQTDEVEVYVFRGTVAVPD